MNEELDTAQGEIERVYQTGKRIDGKNAFTVERELKALEQELIDAGGGALVIDLSALTYISSAGLRIFISVYKLGKKSGVTLYIRNALPQIREIFDVTGLSGLLLDGE